MKGRASSLLQILTLIFAMSIILSGCLAGAAVLVLAQAANDVDRQVLEILGGSIVILSTGLGLPLAWHAWRAVQRRASATFRPRRILPLVMLFVAALALGHAVLGQRLLPAFTFPFLHAAAAVLPAIIALALVGRGLGEIATWRVVVAQLASGAFLAAPLAFVLEAAVLVLFLLVAFLGLLAQPGDQEFLRRLVIELKSSPAALDPGTLTPILQSPLILTAVFCFIAGVVPVVEETFKTLGVGLMSSYRKPSRAQAMLWGTASGAGFAILEGMLNGTGGLDAWAAVVILRVGATLLHSFTGALVGLAWFSILVRRRWIRGLGLYAASVSIHGVWNALSSGMALLSLGVLAGDSSSPEAADAVGVAIIMALLVSLALITGLGLLGVTMFIRRHQASREPLQKQPSTGVDLDALSSNNGPSNAEADR